jgi:uncharacterized phage protein (TIGR02218 family)
MPFAPIETSPEDANVIELYTFTFGAVTDRFTSFNREVTFDGFTWLPTQIAHSAVQASVEDAINELKITVPQDNVIAQQYIANVPGRIGSVRVERGHFDDPAEETVLLFDGFIAQVQFDGEITATMTCKPATNVFKRSGPRFTYQGICNHVLYDARCKVLRTGDPAGEFTFTGTVIGVSGNDIDVSGVSGNGADWAVGGFVKAPAGGDDDARLVLAQSGDTLTLLLPFSIPVIATSVDVLAGCTHDLAICESKFDNVINYGGFPYVPRKNPFNTRLRGGS